MAARYTALASERPKAQRGDFKDASQLPSKRVVLDALRDVRLHRERRRGP